MFGIPCVPTNLAMLALAPWANAVAPLGGGVTRSTEHSFTRIYDLGLWTGLGNGSGSGSTVEAAFGASHIMSHLVLSLNLTSMMDAPCGAMQWQQGMVEFLHRNNPNFRFHGVDVVASVVQANTQHFQSEGIDYVTFQQLDLIDEALPRDYDIVLCRDALMHHSEANVSAQLHACVCTVLTESRSSLRR